MEDINKKNAVDAPVSPTGGNGSRMDEGSNRRLKTTVIVLAVIAAVLALVFAYVWYDRQQMIKDLTIDKENLTNELIELQGEYSQCRQQKQDKAVRERARNPPLHHEALYFPDRFAQYSEYGPP